MPVLECFFLDIKALIHFCEQVKVALVFRVSVVHVLETNAEEVLPGEEFA